MILYYSSVCACVCDCICVCVCMCVYVCVCVCSRTPWYSSFFTRSRRKKSYFNPDPISPNEEATTRYTIQIHSIHISNHETKLTKLVHPFPVYIKKAPTYDSCTIASTTLSPAHLSLSQRRDNKEAKSVK